MMRYRASKLDCDGCSLKPRCCPAAPARKILRSIHEGARDMARDIAATDAYAISRRERKKVEMLFAHLKRILKLDRLRLRGPSGARDEFPPRCHRPEPPETRQTHPNARSQNGVKRTDLVRLHATIAPASLPSPTSSTKSAMSGPSRACAGCAGAYEDCTSPLC